MVSNLLYYGISLGLGTVFSLYFWEARVRNIWMQVAAIVIPVIWTSLLAGARSVEVNGIDDLLFIYDIEISQTIFSGREGALLAVIPMFWAFFFFGCIWIERRIYLDKKDGYQGRWK